MKVRGMIQEFMDDFLGLYISENRTDELLADCSRTSRRYDG